MHFTFKFLLPSLLTIMSFSSCLKEKLVDTPITATYSQKPSDINLQISGMYAQLSGFSCFKNAVITPLILSADNFSGTQGDAAVFSQKLYTPQSRYFVEPWNTCYAVINNANTLLKYLESADASVEFKAKTKSELQFLRGFSYFLLVRMFGGVPLRTEPIDASSDFYLTRNSVDEVYRQLLQDFEQAAAGLPLYRQQPTAEFGNSTKGAAQSMAALAHLTYGNYQDLNNNASGAQTSYAKARDWADSVILSNQYRLLPNYADLWDITKERAAYEEVIFGFQYTRDPGASLASSLGSEIGTWTRPNGQWRIQPWFYDRMVSGDYLNDYRNEVAFITRFLNTANNRMTVTYPRIPATGELTLTQPFLNKFVDPAPLDNRNYENDFPVIRYAEVLLIKAEAENEINGPSVAALAAFNQIRTRARNANGTVRTTPALLTATGLTKETFRRRIFDERGLELVGEGQRWFDLVRMRAPNGKTMYEQLYASELLPVTNGLPVFNATSRTWVGGRIAPNTKVPFEAKYLLFPIPTSEVGVNPKMTQNPGY